LNVYRLKSNHFQFYIVFEQKKCKIIDLMYNQKNQEVIYYV